MSSENDLDVGEVLDGLVESLEQTLDAEQTGRSLPRNRKIERRLVDIPALRGRHGMTQQQFADAVGISVGTLRGWEQKRRLPDGPAMRLLELIDKRGDILDQIATSEVEFVDAHKEGRSVFTKVHIVTILTASGILAQGRFARSHQDGSITILIGDSEHQGFEASLGRIQQRELRHAVSRTA